MSPFIRQLEAQLAQVLSADRYRLRNLLRAVQQAEQSGRPSDQNLDRLQKGLDQSLALRQKRGASVPKIEYDVELPVVARKDEIARTILENQVVVISG